MAASIGRFRVPEQFVGKSLSQLAQEGAQLGRADVLGGFLGIDPSTPFQAGQSFNIGNIPGVDPSGSAELGFITQSFTPEAQAVQQEQRERLGEFTGRLQQVPTQLEAVRQSLGIPQAFETFGAAGQQARDIAGQLRNLPSVQRQATQGFDVSANQLARIIAEQTKQLQPAAETATRGLEASQAGLQNLLTEFASQTEQVFTPFQIEAGLLGDSIAQEFSVFKTQIAADLDKELAQLASQTQLSIADLNRASRLAEIEAASEQGEFRDLGDRLSLINPFTGQEIQSFSKGLAPIRGGVSNPQLGTREQQTQSIQTLQN